MTNHPNRSRSVEMFFPGDSFPTVAFPSVRSAVAAYRRRSDATDAGLIVAEGPNGERYFIVSEPGGAGVMDTTINDIKTWERWWQDEWTTRFRWDGRIALVDESDA